MPLIVKDFEWEQTDVSVRITVPLKGVQPHKADVFSTDEYLKVSYPPYLFEVFLCAPVEDVKGKAAIGNGVVVFSLVKKEGGMWESLQAPDIEDKDYQRKKRAEAIEKAHERAKEEHEKKVTEKREQDRYALRQQMKLDEEERDRIESVKEQERVKATKEIEQWKKRQGQSERATIKCIDSDDDDDTDDSIDDDIREKGDIHDGVIIDNKQTVAKKTHNSISISDSQQNAGKSTGGSNERTQPANVYSRDKDILPSKNAKSSTHAKHQQSGRAKKKELFEKPLPGPREVGSIQVSFTPRAFRTAARESKAPEEEEWLKKVAEACRNKQTLKDNPDAVDMEEMNPLWLKDKGMGFYKAGNYIAAINAFTAAIVLDGSIPSLYSNRAACHLHLKQYKECVQDSTCALELLTPPVPANASSRCKAHVRRGTAFYEVEEYVEALQDYESALKIDPKNESLHNDAEKIRNIIQGTET